MADVAKGDFDEIRGPVQRAMQGDVLFVQGGLEIGERRLDTARHVERVGAVLAGHRQQHAGFPLDQRVTEFRSSSFPDFRHVAQPDGIAPAAFDDRRAEHRRIGKLSFRFYQQALVRRLDITRTADASGLACCLDDIGERDPEFQQPRRIHLDLDLFDLAADHTDVRHAGHGQKQGLELPIRQGPHFHRTRAFGRQADFQKIHRRGNQRRQRRSPRLLRQMASHLGHALGEELPVHEDVGGLVE